MPHPQALHIHFAENSANLALAGGSRNSGDRARHRTEVRYLRPVMDDRWTVVEGDQPRLR